MSSPLRIILTIDFSPWSRYFGGAQQSTHALATALARRGHEVDVIYTRAPWERFAVPPVPYRVHWATLPAFRSHRRALLRPLSGLFVRNTVARILSPEQEAIVHSNGEEGAFIADLRPRWKFRTVATPRHPTYPPQMRPGWPKRPAAWLSLMLLNPKYLAQARAVRSADLVCPPSAYAGRLVAHACEIDLDRIEPVLNGVGERFFEVRRDSSTAQDGGVVFFGRLEADKGILELLSAWDGCSNVGRKLIIVGRGTLEPHVRRRAREDSSIELRPWTTPDALANLLSVASLAVLPSYRESFGNTVAEAMAAGVPVLTSDSTALGELVVHGERGWLVAPQDAVALRRGLDYLLERPDVRERLAEAGRRYALAHLSWERTAECFERKYLALLGTSG